MPRTPKTPQQKKRLSLARDPRNRYGENDKASRKNIPRRRATGNRKYRRALKRGLAPDAEFGVTVPAAAARVRKGGWRKFPDLRLGELVKRQRARASLLVAAQRASSPARAKAEVTDTERPLQLRRADISWGYGGSRDVGRSWIEVHVEHVPTGIRLSRTTLPGFHTKARLRALRRETLVSLLIELNALVARALQPAVKAITRGRSPRRSRTAAKSS